jgi:hypothetical protein
MAKRRKAKKSAKKTRKGLSTWQKFMKQHRGQGHSVQTLARMYRKAGHGKRKPAKRGKRHHSSESVSSRGRGGYRTKFRKELTDRLVEQGLSLATAKKKVSEYMANTVSDAVMRAYAAEFDEKNAESVIAEETRAQRRAREKSIKEAIEGLKAAEKDKDKADKKAAKEKAQEKRKAEYQKAWKEASEAFSGVSPDEL